MKVTFTPGTWWIFFFSFFCSSGLHSQSSRQMFEGKYKAFDSVSGSAVFEYRLIDQDTIKDGQFSFQHFIEHYQQTDSIYGFELNGNYSHDVKNGPWQFVSRNIAITGNVKASGSQVLYDASGREYLVSALFENGVVNGDYIFLQRRIEASNPVDTFFYSRTSYSNGTITGSLEGFTDRLKVRGQFDNDGFPDGNWFFLHKTDDGYLEEIRYYDHGFFSRHYYKINNRLVEVKHIGFDTLAKSGRGLLTRLPATDTYFRALDYTNIVMDTSAISRHVNTDSSGRYISRANAFMKKVFMHPGRYNSIDIWREVGQNNPVPPIRIKISKFSFTEEELLQNRDNEKLLAEIQSLLEAFFKNPNTETGRFNNRELGKYYSVLDIYRSRINSIAPVINFLADSASEYVNHDAILQHNAVPIVYPQRVEYTFENEEISDVYNFPPSLSAFKSESLHKHMTIVFEDITSVVKHIESAFSEYQAQSALTVAESRLIALRDSVIHLFSDSITNAKNRLITSIKPAATMEIERSFKLYAASPVMVRLRTIDSVEYCFAGYADMYATLIHFQDLLREIDQEYTRSVWNAYTYTYMEERVKERLYNVFDREVFPHMWKELEANLSCDKLSVALYNIDRLLQRMLELRMEDTKDLERKMRRVKRDMAAYITLLNLADSTIKPGH